MSDHLPSDQVDVPALPSPPPPSVAQVREEQRRLKEESQRERQLFHATKTSVEEAWKRLVRNHGGPSLDRDLRHAALNLLEDTQLARLGEQKQAASRLRAEGGRREAQERYLALFNSMEQGFCTIEVAFDENQQPTDYCFLEVSPSFERQTGIANASGRWMREIAPDQDQFWYDIYGHVARTGEEARFENYSTPLDRWWSVYAFRTKEPSLGRIAVFFHDITDRKRAEAALQASQERLQTLADAVPQLIWTNSGAGVANYFNRRWYEYTGLTYEDSVGLGWEAVVHPEDAPASKERWHRALAAGEIFDSEYRLRCADGAYRWFIGRNVPERDAAGKVTGWFGTATDIHDLKEAEAAVRETQERMRLIVENAREYAIFSMDLERRITSWNSGAQRILGYTPEEAQGQQGDIIFTEEDRAAAVPQREAATALQGGRAADERWHLRKDGSRFWGSGVMMAMHDARGEAVGLVKIFRDQTEQLEAKTALERSLSETEQARAEAEAAGQAKDHFLAVLSHELRTPLTPVLMSVDFLMLHPDLPPEVLEGLEMIQRNVTLESQFIDEILDLTKISRGKLELSCEPMDLHRAIQLAAEVARPDLESKAQRLTIALDAGAHELIGDFKRLQQIFWNLLKNASKFTPERGEIAIRTLNEPTGSDQPAHVLVAITDNGIGFDTEVAEKIFDAFTQADAAITQKFGGLGLGLAISKASVDAHGGTIRGASPGAGEGATFTVSLPLGERPDSFQ